MKIEKLTLQNFKAFLAQTELDFKGGKNVLVYGTNGSGKSSLYYALYTFFESGRKSRSGDLSYHKYFNKRSEERLLNYFDTEDRAMQVSVQSAGKEYIFALPPQNLLTDEVVLGNATSDFLNYKLLFGFYYFRNSEEADVFPIFLHDILPYLVSTRQNRNYAEWYNELHSEIDEIDLIRPRRKDSRVYKELLDKIKAWNADIEPYFASLNEPINEYLQKSFGEPDMKVRLDYVPLGIKVDTFNVIEHTRLLLKVTYKGIVLTRPHTFLNEARLTSLALSIRLAVFDNRIKDTEGQDDMFKILVIDDLLISLDMQHRMTVIRMLLDKFADYQLFVLTHDEAFYNILKEKTLSRDWLYFKFREDTQNHTPHINQDEDDFHKAKRFFEEGDYDACANHLRKESEKILKLYLDKDLKSIENDFRSLQDFINSVSNVVGEEDLANFEKKFKQTLKSEELAQFGEMVENFKQNRVFLELPQGKVRGVLKGLMQYFLDIQTQTNYRKKIIAELQSLKDRILNPRSHSQISEVAPLYPQELEEAIALVRGLHFWFNQNTIEGELVLAQDTQTYYLTVAGKLRAFPHKDLVYYLGFWNKPHSKVMAIPQNLIGEPFPHPKDLPKEMRIRLRGHTTIYQIWEGELRHINGHPTFEDLIGAPLQEGVNFIDVEQADLDLYPEGAPLEQKEYKPF